MWLNPNETDCLHCISVHNTYVNRYAVIDSLSDDGLSLDIDILSVLDGHRLNVFAVQEERHRLGVHPHSDLMPVTVKQAVHFWVLKDGPDRILSQTHCIVLHRSVLAVQTDGNLRNAVILAGPNALQSMILKTII